MDDFMTGCPKEALRSLSFKMHVAFCSIPLSCLAGLDHFLSEQPTLSEKRYKSCHWGCTFSKGKLLSILGANMSIS